MIVVAAAELFGVSPTNSKFRAMLQAWKALFLRAAAAEVNLSRCNALPELGGARMRGSPTIYPQSSSSWLSRSA